MNNELEHKLNRISALLTAHELDALLVQRISNFAWLTGGAASYINTADLLGVASLLITPNVRYLITNNIEAPRFRQEEGLEEQGWSFQVGQWYQSNQIIQDLTRGLRLGSDGFYPAKSDLSAELAAARITLTEPEQERFRALSQGCAQAMDTAIRSLSPGMSEYEIAAVLGSEAQKRGILPIVNLIATDGRVYAFRHPLPTAKKLENYAMLVLCGRKDGLVASITRFVHFGALPEDLRRKAQAVAQIDAIYITETTPGRSLGEIFSIAQAAYEQQSYAKEWQLHHQGGPAGYLPREIVATPNAGLTVDVGQAYAWNPSITGTKSEDTILITEQGFEVMTEIDSWPVTPVDLGGRTILRPGILELT